MTARTVLLFAVVALLAGCGGGPTILSTQPGGGGLPPGETALVDDGKCPTGQVDKVTGAATLTGSRSYSCVPRPKS